MQISSAPKHLPTSPIAQENSANKSKQKAPPTPQPPMPAPSHSAGAEKAMVRLQEQRIHSAFTAIAQSEGSSNGVAQAKKTEQELLKRLKAESSDSNKISLEAGPLPGGWPRRRSDRTRVDTSPPNWQGLRSHSDDTNMKLVMLVDAMSQAADDRIGPHVTINDLNSNARVMSTLREYVQTAQENYVQPHSLSHILNHLINN